MTEEQMLKFYKYVAKQLKKAISEKEIDSTIHNRKFKVKVCSIIPPKKRYDNFRVNVKVTSSIGRRFVYDKDGFRLRDENRAFVYEWSESKIKRSDVNRANSRIRCNVEMFVRNYIDMFGVEPWRVKVEKVSHS